MSLKKKMNSNILDANLNFYQKRSTQILTNWLEKPKFKQTQLVDAMRYASLLGGKRVRPFLVYATGKMFNACDENLDTPAAAIEFMHAYSLIHDDLPAMDNDILRRGQPTCHIKYSPAIAILAGDALQSLAFGVLANGNLGNKGECNRIAMLKELSKASGIDGMCIGQAFDLDAESKKIDLDMLETIHLHKTGAIINCAIQLGALAAGVNDKEILEKLRQFAKTIGLAFQVQDDILDITGASNILGKTSGSDLENAKSTYPALLGLEHATKKAQTLAKSALDILKALPYDTQLLEEFTYYIIERKH